MCPPRGETLTSGNRRELTATLVPWPFLYPLPSFYSTLPSSTLDFLTVTAKPRVRTRQHVRVTSTNGKLDKKKKSGWSDKRRDEMKKKCLVHSKLKAGLPCWKLGKSEQFTCNLLTADFSSSSSSNSHGFSRRHLRRHALMTNPHLEFPKGTGVIILLSARRNCLWPRFPYGVLMCGAVDGKILRIINF